VAEENKTYAQQSDLSNISTDCSAEFSFVTTGENKNSKISANTLSNTSIPEELGVVASTKSELLLSSESLYDDSAYLTSDNASSAYGEQSDTVSPNEDITAVYTNAVDDTSENDISSGSSVDISGNDISSGSSVDVPSEDNSSDDSTQTTTQSGNSSDNATQTTTSEGNSSKTHPRSNGGSSDKASSPTTEAPTQTTTHNSNEGSNSNGDTPNNLPDPLNNDNFPDNQRSNPSGDNGFPSDTDSSDSSDNVTVPVPNTYGYDTTASVANTSSEDTSSADLLPQTGSPVGTNECLAGSLILIISGILLLKRKSEI
jgi:hypothetical protein